MRLRVFTPFGTVDFTVVIRSSLFSLCHIGVQSWEDGQNGPVSDMDGHIKPRCWEPPGHYLSTPESGRPGFVVPIERRENCERYERREETGEKMKFIALYIHTPRFNRTLRNVYGVGSSTVNQSSSGCLQIYAPS